MATTKKGPAVPETAKRKTSGIGFVWSETTGAVGELAGTVGELATAGRVLGQNAKAQAALSRIETSQEILTQLGVEAQGMEALVAADQLVDYICNKR